MKKILLVIMVTLTIAVFALGVPLYADKFAPSTNTIPTASTPTASKVLDIQTATTESGVEIWLVEDHSVPVISMDFSFDGGLLYDPEDKPGVGRLVSILLDEGAGELDSTAFQKELNAHSIHLRFMAGRDAFHGELKTLTKHKDKAFNLLKTALTQPHFSEDAMTRMKNSNIADIKHNLEDPSWLSARVFNGMLFEGHPYAKPGHGHLASMESITRDDLVTFTQKQFAQNVLQVSIAGDITQDEAMTLVHTVFGELSKEAAPLEIEDITPKYAGKTILFPTKSAQTFIALANEGVNREDSNWYAATVMNYILGGGGFESRLMSEIRKKRGLTYGVYSHLSPMKHAQLIRAGLSTSNEKAAEAITVLKEEWQKMAEYGATEEELQNAKDYLTGSLLLQLTSTSQISAVMSGLQQDGLDPDYINKRNKRISNVTLADVQRVAKDLLRTEAATVILAGQPEGIEADITLDEVPEMK